MPLQIQYQPNAMMLGSMAQSAGEAAYNRWLTEFNQQKMQMNANAFATGFANMGLPIAQMKSRERMVNAQIAGRGQQLAQKRMADVQWWENNGALVQDAVASNLIAQHGPSVINDSTFADQVINAPKYMSREDAQTMLTRHAGFDERARSHRVARSPEALDARSAGRLADVEAGLKVNPVSQKQYDALQRRFNERGIKGQAYEKIRRGIDERIKRHGDQASRQETHEEATHRLVRTKQLGDGPLDGQRTIILDPKTGGIKDIIDTNPNADLMEIHAKQAAEIGKLSAPPTTLEGEAVTLDPLAQKARNDTIKQLMRSNKAIMDKVYGPNNDPADKPIDAAEEYQTDLKRWNSQTALGPPEARGVPGTPFGEMSNEEYLKSIHESGLLLNLMKQFGVEDASDLPREVWSRLGFTAPYPKKPDTRGVIQRNQEEAQKAVKDAGIMSEMDRLRSSLRTGQPPQESPVTPIPLKPTTTNGWMALQEDPKSLDEANNIRRGFEEAVKSGQLPEDHLLWPPEMKAKYLKVRQYIASMLRKKIQEEGKAAKEKKVEDLLKSMRPSGSWSFGPSSSSPM